MAHSQPDTLSTPVPSGANRPLEYADPAVRRQSPSERVDPPRGLGLPSIA